MSKIEVEYLVVCVLKSRRAVSAQIMLEDVIEYRTNKSVANILTNYLKWESC